MPQTVWMEEKVTWDKIPMHWLWADQFSWKDQEVLEWGVIPGSDQRGIRGALPICA